MVRDPAGWMSPNRLAISALIVTLALLSGATVSLRSVHEHVREARVRDHVERGQRAVAGQRLDAAVTEFRAALALDRDNVTAHRALTLALLSLDRLDEGESHLEELLRQHPTDGVLNRAAARIHAKRGRAVAARSAYQRAIYGEWTGDVVAERNRTRFELIDYLTSIGARDEVLPEVLRLRTELPSGRTVSARRAADLLVGFGAADLAIETLRTTALAMPKDVELLAHLARLQSDAGLVQDAAATLRRAVSLEPARADLDEQLRVVTRVLALDPTLPRLGLVTRTRRARLLLEQVVEGTRPCEGDPTVRALRLDAERRLRSRQRADAEAADEELAAAGRLWSAAPACQAGSIEARAIGQVLQRVGAAAEPST